MQYFYDKQIRKYIQQFIRLFSGFSVEMGTQSDGQKIYQTVPVRYGDVSRMAAHIVKDNSENVVNATPFISCYVSDMSIAPERRTHAQYSDKVQVYEKKYDLGTNQYLDEVGDTYQITRYQPVPYNLTMQVDIVLTDMCCLLRLNSCQFRCQTSFHILALCHYIVHVCGVQVQYSCRLHNN
jgi:hypothetical protein